MKHIAVITAVGVVLSACQTTSGSEPASAVSRDAVLSATAPAEILALGARPLGAAEIRSELVGKTLKEGGTASSGWTWQIKSDGTASSKADDGSWSTSSTWDIAGNQYCRQSADTPRKCSDVYELGGIYRFSETPKKLANWSVVVK